VRPRGRGCSQLRVYLGGVPQTTKIILNGDVKHEFGRISKQEWRDVLRLFDYLEKKCEELIVVKGNHDTILGPLAQKRKLIEVKDWKWKDILVLHGDYEPKKTAPIILMGHEHPAVSLKEGGKIERYKCFLKGKYKKSILIVQPSFNPLVEGSDVTRNRVLSPLITNVGNMEVFVVDESTHNTLPFGKVKNISQ